MKTTFLILVGLFVGQCLCSDPECMDEQSNPISTGLFKKEGDCKQYYQCSHGKLYVHQCGDGMAFDSTIGMCNYAIRVYPCQNLAGVPPHLVDYCRNNDGSNSQPPPIAKPGTCDIFYKCFGVRLEETTCPPGQNFNPNIDYCDFKQNFPCVPVSTTTVSPPPSTTDLTPGQSSTVTSTTTVVSTVTYLGFVVDNTGSMANEIEGVKEWIRKCVNGLGKDCATLPTGGWLMTSFNDPLSQNGPVIGPTTNVEVIINAIGGLIAHGGYDCPEYAFTGLENAIDAIPDDAGACKIFFYTDALAKDEYMAESVRQKYTKKGCSFIPILTRCCGKCEDPPEYYRAIDGRTGQTEKRRRRSASVSGENAYYMLANKTGGTIFLTDKPSSPNELLEFLEEEVTLGFCPTSLIAGPPPNGYTNEHDCNLTRSCWDRSMDKCFCMSETEPCPKDPIVDPNYCKMDEEHSYLPDPTDCAKFYQCSFGNIWRKDCAEGTVFDPAVGTCNHPYNTAPPCGTKVVE